MNDESRTSEDTPPRADPPIQFCPVCSARLESRHCKMICPQCNFFMSCSEFE